MSEYQVAGFIAVLYHIFKQYNSNCHLFLSRSDADEEHHTMSTQLSAPVHREMNATPCAPRWRFESPLNISSL